MAISAPQDRRPIVISGPSGAGKGTLIQKLFDKHPGEIEGVAYFFVSPSEFFSLCSRGALVEHACFSGNYYGTSKQTVDDQTSKGLVVVLDIEMQGVKQMKANHSIFADSQGSYDKIIVNDSLEAAYKELEDFVFGPKSR